MMKREISKMALGIIAIFTIMLASACDSNSSFVGEYTYTDAVDHSYSLILYSNGDAELKMTSTPSSELMRIAYSDVLRGLNGYWEPLKFRRGEGVANYADIYFGNANLMIYDGIIYSDFYALQQKNTSAGSPISNVTGLRVA